MWDWLKSLNEVAAGIQAIGAIVSAVITVILAGLTFWYVRLTRQMALEMRSAREPFVFLDLELGGEWSEHLVIENVGQLPAVAVRFVVEHDTLRTDERIAEALKDGIDYLPPSRRRKIRIGRVDWRSDEPVRKLRIAFTYKNRQGQVFSDRADFDLAQYAKVSSDTFQDSGHAVAKAIEKGNDRALRGGGKHGVLRAIGLRRGGWNKKRCEWCGSRIPEQARKCPKCHERLDTAVMPNALHSSEAEVEEIASGWAQSGIDDRELGVPAASSEDLNSQEDEAAAAEEIKSATGNAEQPESERTEACTDAGTRKPVVERNAEAIVPSAGQDDTPG